MAVAAASAIGAVGVAVAAASAGGAAGVTVAAASAGGAASAIAVVPGKKVLKVRINMLE